MSNSAIIFTAAEFTSVFVDHSDAIQHEHVIDRQNAFAWAKEAAVATFDKLFE